MCSACTSILLPLCRHDHAQGLRLQDRTSSYRVLIVFRPLLPVLGRWESTFFVQEGAEFIR